VDIYVVEVIEVLAIEPPKYQHGTAKETSAVPTPGLRGISTDLQICNGIAFRVKHENIAKVIAKSAAVDINFTIVD
jgi:hypothetical protein